MCLSLAGAPTPMKQTTVYFVTPHSLFLLGQKAPNKGNITFKFFLFSLHGGGETGLRAALQN